MYYYIFSIYISFYFLFKLVIVIKLICSYFSYSAPQLCVLMTKNPTGLETGPERACLSSFHAVFLETVTHF